MIDTATKLKAFFWECVNRIWSKNRLPEDLQTEQYLVMVLERFFRQDEARILEEPLLKKLYECSLRDTRDQFAEIRHIGDAALFIAGFFGERARRSLVGIQHYRRVGECAYEMLCVRFDEHNACSLTHQKLSEDLTPFIRILEDIQNEYTQTLDAQNPMIVHEKPDPSQASMGDIMRTWERYLVTHDAKSRAWLEERGVMVNSALENVWRKWRM